MSKLTVRAGVVLAVMSLLVGCEAEGPEPDPGYAIVAEAKDCLARADFDCARAKYESVKLGDDLKLQDEVRVGLLLTDMAYTVKRAGATLAEAAELFDKLAQDEDAAPAWDSAAEKSLVGTAIPNRAIYNLIVDDWNETERLIAAFDEVIGNGRDFRVTVEQLPLVAGRVPITILQGEFAPADLLLMRSWLSLAASALGLVLATDFDLPIGDVLQYAMNVPECDNITTAEAGQRCASLVTAFAVGNSPVVLGLEPNRGVIFRDKAREYMARFFDDSAAFMTRLRSETVAEDNSRFLSWSGVDAEADGSGWVNVRVGEISLTSADVRDLFTGDLELTAPYEHTDRMVRFVVDDGVSEVATATAASLRSDSARFVPLEKSVMPVITTGAEVVLQSDSIVSMLQIMVSALDPEFGKVVADVAREVVDLYSDESNADAVHNLFVFLFPPSLEVDLGAYFRSTAHLKQFVPALREVTDVTHDFTDLPTYEWMVEYECDLMQVNFLLCPDIDAVDAPHFAGSAYELVADGYASRVGYVAWPDPDFGGMVRFNPRDIDLQYAEGVISPDLQQINSLIQNVGHELLNRIEKD